MVAGGLEIAKAGLKWLVVGSALLAMILTMMAITNMALAGIVSMNTNVFGDVVAIAQIWAPINLYSVISWLVGGATAFIIYKFTVAAKNYLKELLS